MTLPCQRFCIKISWQRGWGSFLAWHHLWTNPCLIVIQFLVQKYFIILSCFSLRWGWYSNKLHSLAIPLSTIIYKKKCLNKSMTRLFGDLIFLVLYLFNFALSLNFRKKSSIKKLFFKKELNSFGSSDSGSEAV